MIITADVKAKIRNEGQFKGMTGRCRQMARRYSNGGDRKQLFPSQIRRSPDCNKIDDVFVSKYGPPLYRVFVHLGDCIVIRITSYQWPP